MNKKLFLVVALAFAAVLVSGTYFGAQAACGISLPSFSLCPCSGPVVHQDRDIMAYDLDMGNPRLDTAIGQNPYVITPEATVPSGPMY